MRITWIVAVLALCWAAAPPTPGSSPDVTAEVKAHDETTCRAEARDLTSEYAYALRRSWAYSPGRRPWADPTPTCRGSRCEERVYERCSAPAATTSWHRQEGRANISRPAQAGQRAPEHVAAHRAAYFASASRTISCARSRCPCPSSPRDPVPRLGELVELTSAPRASIRRRADSMASSYRPAFDQRLAQVSGRSAWVLSPGCSWRSVVRRRCAK